MRRWYLIYSKLRQEKCALENLERQGYVGYLPFIPVEKLRQGTLTLVDEPLFPRYLFIHLGLDHSAKSWGPIRSTRGVTRLVCFGMEPAKVEDDLIAFLKKKEAALRAEPERLFVPGDPVRLQEGPFFGIEGIYQMTDGERRALVLIDFLSKPLTVRVSPAGLCKTGLYPASLP
ncbi:MAG: transcription/translation regulatory transformer protein RfaH [Zoogloeaceae bacterium]|jgi:transcriptional antiterminator RfaH|nr:transcription/translation regulatory transformer protein RfaH [Zoogloeaceae bacterium]